MQTITCFICSLSSGGAEHQMTELINLLQHRGYRIRLVTFADVTDHYRLPDGIERVRIAEGKDKICKFLGIFYYFLTVKTDCVISFGQRENVFALLPLFFRRRIKVIAGERNFTIGKPTQKEKLLIQYLYRRADYIVPNNYSQSKYIVGLRPQYVDKVVTITNYTDIHLYKYSNYYANEIMRIGVFGRYNVQKNCERFVEAIRLLKECYDNTFVIEWYGNQYFKDKSINQHYVMMSHKVKQYNLEDVLHLNNHISNVSEELLKFDAICLPSLFEGFSNSIAEAICCGRPMLVSDVSDNGVMVKDGVNGFLFNPLEIEDIVQAFLKFFNLNEEMRKQMSWHSRKIAEELFDANIFVNKYIELIHDTSL